jgi:hypothetical protein
MPTQKSSDRQDSLHAKTIQQKQSKGVVFDRKLSLHLLIPSLVGAPVAEQVKHPSLESYNLTESHAQRTEEQTTSAPSQFKLAAKDDSRGIQDEADRCGMIIH